MRWLVLLSLLVLVSGCICTNAISTQIFGSMEQKDLGAKSDTNTFDRIVAENGFKLSSPAGNYCLECDITYHAAKPLDVTLNSDELTSYLQSVNNEKGTLKNMQVKLGDNNEAEVSAYVDLTDKGYDFKGPIYAHGKIEKATDNSIKITLDKSQTGDLDAPEEIQKIGQEKLEEAINSKLAAMPGLKIDTLEINDGKLHYDGTFPKEMDAP